MGLKMAAWEADVAQRLTLVEAFDAMEEFVRAFWKRSLEPDDTLGYFVDIVHRYPGGAADPAHWHDWLEAVARAKARSFGPGRSANLHEAVLRGDGLLERLRAAIASEPAGRHHSLTWEDAQLLFSLLELARRAPPEEEDEGRAR